jgi:DNA-binding winged helix-turn-helix (wHTH) protein/TolB-like protein/tetratricopeptide (TPR) repeat protein
MQPLNGDDKVIYRFDVFQLDPTRRLLLKDGQAVQLTPKTLDTLLALVRNRGRVMEKDELMQAVWPDTIVEETNLAHNISALRKIFGQKGSDNRFIITAPGRGYSFVAEVQRESPGAQESRGAIAASHSVTVLADAPQAPADAPQAPADAPQAPAVALASTPQAQADHKPERAAIAGPHFRISRRAAIVLLILISGAAAVFLVRAFRNAPAAPLQSLAVLPFKPLVADARDEVLEMGIADTLITRLNNLKQITVRPISVVRRYTALDQDPVAAGRELDVQAVLEGSIQKAEGKIRVTARLIRIADGRPLWTGQFDEQWTNIFAVQDAISERVASDLMVSLPGEARNDLARNYTKDPEAYQLFLVGRYHWNKRTGDGIRESIKFFQQAITQDPQYALAYVGLADAYTTLGSYHIAAPLKVLPLAREMAEKALKLDSRLAEAHATMGKILTDFVWDWPQAEKEFQTAIELQPNYSNAHHWYAVLLVSMGRADEAVREALRAQELEPRSAVINTLVGSTLYRARRYDQAIASLQKTLEAEPTFIAARFYLGLSYLMQGNHNEAVAEFQKGRETMPDNPDMIALLGYVAGLNGQRDLARSYQKELNEVAKRRYVAPFTQSAIPSGLGEWDEVFKWLEQCCEQRDSFIRGLKTDPLFDRVPKDQRFNALLHCAGLES